MSKKQILVADDEYPITRSISRLLESAGFQCLLAANGEEALRLVRTQRPSAILLDLDMPVMSGTEVLRLLREDPELREIPVCILSALSQCCCRLGEPIEGVQRVLPKPYDPVELLEAVREMVEEDLGDPDPPDPAQ